MPVERRIEANGATPFVVETTGPDGAARLEGVGVRLQRAAHPGVVAVLESAPTPDGGWRLCTVHGGGPLSTVGELDPARLAAIAAAVATTLADLHELGIVHGRINEHRILLGPHGGPLLCSFGPEPVGLAAEDDVADLAAALRSLLGDPRSAGGTTASRTGRDPRRTLAKVLDAAIDADPARRPSMRRFAASLADVASSPSARTAGRRRVEPAPQSLPRPIVRATGDRPHRRLATGRAPLVVVGLLLVGTTVGLLHLRPSPTPKTDARGGRSTRPIPAEPRRVDDDAAATCAVFSDQPRKRSEPRCPHSISIAGRVVTIDGRQFEVGELGDRIAVGSFACAGEATIAVLRPTTGDLFVFAEAGSVPQDVPALMTVDRAAALRALTISERCQQLRVVGADGADTPVDLTDRA